MIKKTYHFSLIEVIIATSLFAILIFSTTSLFFKYHKLNARLDHLRPKVFERTLFYEKMMDMSHSIDISTIGNSSYEYQDFLSFTFDNGFKDDAKLSGRCLCKLYRTIDNEIKYDISNEKEKNIVYTRTLLTNVSHFTHHIENGLLTIKIAENGEPPLSYCFILPAKKGGP